MKPPYRAGPSTELAPKSVPPSFWQRVKPTLRFGIPGMIVLIVIPALRMIMGGDFLVALVSRSWRSGRSRTERGVSSAFSPSRRRG